MKTVLTILACLVVFVYTHHQTYIGEDYSWNVRGYTVTNAYRVKPKEPYRGRYTDYSKQGTCIRILQLPFYSTVIEQY